MSLHLLRLDFGSSRLHLGGYEDQVGLEGSASHLLADTFFSAICHGWLLLYGSENLTELLNQFNSANPPWRMSDGFPHVFATPLLPKPIFTFLTPTGESEDEDDIEASRRKKAFKNLSFLRANDMQDFIRKGPKTIFFQDYENLDFMESVLIPQVAVSRGEDDPNPFQANYIWFKEKCGFWVLFQMEDESRLEQLKQVVDLLGYDIGIGGEKSTGAGRFTPEWSEFKDGRPNLALQLLTSLTDNMSFGVSESSDTYLLLSLANPNGPGDIATVQAPSSRYRLTYRRGFHYSESDGWPGPVKKRPVGMLMAGSLLPQKIQGRLVDVTPDLKGDQSAPHRLYRYGFALCAGV